MYTTLNSGSDSLRNLSTISCPTLYRSGATQLIFDGGWMVFMCNVVHLLVILKIFINKIIYLRAHNLKPIQFKRFNNVVQSPESSPKQR